MRFGKSLGLLALLIPTLSFAVQILQVSEQEQKLLGIEVQTISAVEEGGAGEITLRVAFGRCLATCFCTAGRQRKKRRPACDCAQRGYGVIAEGLPESTCRG